MTNDHGHGSKPGDPGPGDAFSRSHAYDLSRTFAWRMAGLDVAPVRGGGIVLRDVTSGAEVAVHPGVEGWAWLSPLGDWLVVGGVGRVDGLDLSGAMRWTFRPRGDHVGAFAFRNREVRVTSGGDGGDRIDEVISLETGLPARTG